MVEVSHSEQGIQPLVVEDIQPRTDRADDVADILIHEAEKHAPEYGERAFRKNVYKLMEKVSQKKLTLMLDDDNHRYRVAFGDELHEGTGEVQEATSDLLPQLHIRDKTAFMAEIAKLHHIIGLNFRNGHGGEWAYGQKDMDVWFNATHDDFANSERFLREQIYSLEAEPFKNLGNERKQLGYLNLMNQPFSVQNAESDPKTESSHELQFRIGEDETDDLPAVRYACINADTAIIYAVQMPFIEGDSQRTVIDKIQKRLGDRGNLEKKLAKFEGRKEKMQRFNQYLGRTILNEDKEVIGHVPDDLAGTPPNALLSFTASLEMLRQQGIRQIKIPTYLPWRQHMDKPDFEDPEGKIDKRILEQTARLVRRAAFEIKGIEVTSFGEEDGYIHLSLAADLRSNRPILSEALTLTKAVDVM